MIKRWLMAVLVFFTLTAQAVASPIAAGDWLTFMDYLNTNSGGAFIATKTDATGTPTTPTTSFVTFCLEQNEYINLTEAFYVGAVSTSTISALAAPDPLDPRTAWLITQYLSGAFGVSIAVHNALQAAIWFIENEPAGVNNGYVALATLAAPTTLGNVRVLNLYRNVNGTLVHAQDQLVTVTETIPEPATMMLMSMGLLGFAARLRR